MKADKQLATESLWKDMRGAAMTYIRNWPEGLFILLVMLAPLTTTWVFHRLLYLLLIPVGFVVWIVVLWAVCKWHDLRARDRTDGPQ